MFTIRQILGSLLVGSMSITSICAAPAPAPSEAVQLSARAPGLPALHGKPFNIMHKHVSMDVASVVQNFLIELQNQVQAEIQQRYPKEKIEVVNRYGGTVSFPPPDVSIVLKDVWLAGATEQKWKDRSGKRHQHDNAVGYAVFSLQDQWDGVLTDGSAFRTFEEFRRSFERVFGDFITGRATTAASPDAFCPYPPLFEAKDCGKYTNNGYRL